MKYVKAGQYVNINDIIYRAANSVNKCQGCVFNDSIACPRIRDLRASSENIIACLENGIIFKKVK